eukprot:scaffold29194_cov122-Isochrysis_galbana.AAC.3
MGGKSETVTARNVLTVWLRLAKIERDLPLTSRTKICCGWMPRTALACCSRSRSGCVRPIALHRTSPGKRGGGCKGLSMVAGHLVRVARGPALHPREAVGHASHRSADAL